jgi:hypothetical protein
MRDLIKTILKEETEDLDRGVLIFLRRRVQIDTKDLSFGSEKPLIVKSASFNIDGDWYNINSFMSKKEMTWKILNMLEENNQINFAGYDPNVLNTDRQKVIRTIRYFIDEVIRKK